MKHISGKKTGLCRVCGRSTKLFVHQECGAKAAGKKAVANTVGKKTKARKYSDWFVENLARIDS